MKKTNRIILTLAGALGLATSSQAATILGVTIEDVSSEIGGVFDRKAAYTLNGVGYDYNVTNTHTGATDPHMWLSAGTLDVGDGANLDPLPAHITFDLGANYDLDGFTVWNYNETAGGGLSTRGANAVTVSVASSEVGSFTALAGITTFAEAPGDDTTLFGETFDLTSDATADNVRLVRIDIASNHLGDNDFAGLSEIRFGGTVVPEPGSMALFGLGGLALVLRRRRR